MVWANSFFQTIKIKIKSHQAAFALVLKNTQTIKNKRTQDNVNLNFLNALNGLLFGISHKSR